MCIGIVVQFVYCTVCFPVVCIPVFLVIVGVGVSYAGSMTRVVVMAAAVVVASAPLPNGGDVEAHSSTVPAGINNTTI